MQTLHISHGRRQTTDAIVRQMPGRRSNKIVFSTQEGLSIIAVHNIIYCEAQSNYCKVVLKDDTSLLISKPLKHVERYLPAGLFVRPHQSFIVLLDEITQVRDVITLTNGARIPLSRSNRKAFTELLRTRFNVV